MLIEHGDIAQHVPLNAQRQNSAQPIPMGEGTVVTARQGNGGQGGGGIDGLILDQGREILLPSLPEGISRRYVGKQPFGHENRYAAFRPGGASIEKETVGLSLSGTGGIKQTLLTGGEKIGESGIVGFSADKLCGACHKTAASVIQVFIRNEFHRSSQKRLKYGQKNEGD